MTNGEKKKFKLIQDRVRMLEVRLEQTPKEAVFYHEIRRELEAMQWAVKKINEGERSKDEVARLSRLVF